VNTPSGCYKIASFKIQVCDMLTNNLWNFCAHLSSQSGVTMSRKRPTEGSCSMCRGGKQKRCRKSAKQRWRKPSVWKSKCWAENQINVKLWIGQIKRLSFLCNNSSVNTPSGGCIHRVMQRFGLYCIWFWILCWDTEHAWD
jgi:hypothetical protein